MSAGDAVSAMETTKNASPPPPTAGRALSGEGSTAAPDRTDPESGPSAPAAAGADSAPPGEQATDDTGSKPSGAGAVPAENGGGGSCAASEDVTGDGAGSAAEGTTETGAAAPAPDADKPVASSEGQQKAEADKEQVQTEAAGEGTETEPMEVEDAQASAEKEAEALTVEKEEPGVAESAAAPQCVVVDMTSEEPAGSPLKNIKVMATATIGALLDSGDEDDPVPVTPTNGDVSGRSPSERGERPPRRAAAVRADTSNKNIGGGRSPTRTNGSAPSGGEDDAGDAITVVAEMTAEKTADVTACQAAPYGIVPTIYKELPAPSAPGGKSLRPLAVKPPGTVSSAASSALLSSRRSKCIICNWIKPIKYMMMANGSSSGNVICSEECLEKCVNSVTAGRMSVLGDASAGKTPPPASTVSSAPTLTVASVTSLSSPTTVVPAAAKTPSSAGSAAPVVPAVPATSAPVSAATPAARARTECQNAECGRQIPSTSSGRQLRTVWETMVFCSPICAIQHQKKDGSACVFCKMDLPEMIMGKYCVRFGSDVRQFCSNLCLDGFKKRLKVCSFCQRDITRFQGSFLAPVGNAGSHQFKEFCSQSCLTRYKTTHNEQGKSQATWAKCSVCLKNTPVEHRVAVKPNEPVKQLCSKICLKAYQFAIKDEGMLEPCAVCKALLAVNNMAQFRVWNGSAMSYLCSQSCSNVFVLSNRRIVSCRYCRVKKYNFDMMEMTSEKDGLFCSVHCLKNCGKRIGAPPVRRDKAASGADPSSAPNRKNTTNCAHCGTSVDSSSFSNSIGNSSVFCGTKCAQANIQEKRNRAADAPAASNGVDAAAAAAALSGRALPLIQSVMSLAADDEVDGSAAAAAALLPAARRHPALVLMPPAPVSRRNVSVQVQPRKTERERDERIERKEKKTATIATQTDAGGPPVLPLPIPMYVPVPMAMYNCPYPLPVPLVVPVPVPLLCGAEDALRLLCGLPGLHRTQQQQQQNEQECASSERPAPGKRRRSSSSASEAASPAVAPEPRVSSGCGDSPPGSPDSGGGEATDQPPPPPPHKRRKVDAAAPEEEGSPPAAGPPVDLVELLRAPCSAAGPPQEEAAPRGTEFLGPSDASHACHNSSVKYTWCVRVFEQFIQERNRRPAAAASDSDSDSAGADSESRQRLVADPLQASPAELAAGLRALTSELRRPNGQPYPPDLIHYVLIGIQLYLLENGRRDSLFWGAEYSELGAAVEERLRPIAEQLSPRTEVVPRPESLTTHVEEQQLWDAKVLGVHSPQSLLTTVVFFVTKHFVIGSLRWHQKLSFAMIQESIALKLRLQQSSLKLLDSRNAYKRSKTYEMPANTENPFQCPVKFLEFYLSRCPESARSSRTCPLYLTPAPDTRPDGSAWYCSEPLPTAVLQQLIARLLTVRELQTALLSDNSS